MAQGPIGLREKEGGGTSDQIITSRKTDVIRTPQAQVQVLGEPVTSHLFGPSFRDRSCNRSADAFCEAADEDKEAEWLLDAMFLAVP